MDEPFNATFYSTIAQIIPVYFLAIVGVGVVFRRQLSLGMMSPTEYETINSQTNQAA